MSLENKQAQKPSAPLELEQWLQAQKHQDLLRFITCGSVDDGKSTLIGRLLWESQQVFADQFQALQDEALRAGSKDIDFSHLVDGLAAEREQGITIDVAYRFFSTQNRKFIVADTPGHEQYTRNMVTGASTANAAVLLVDARQGLLTQTRRHAYLMSLIGIQHMVLAVNKMDLVHYQADTFDAICQAFAPIAKALGIQHVTPIPMSALHGENVVQPSQCMPWYKGPSLMQWLETVDTSTHTDNPPFIFPVQWIARTSSAASFRGLCGTIVSGQVKVGDTLRVTASGAQARVAKILSLDHNPEQAHSDQAVCLELAQAVDVSRGDVLTHTQAPIEQTDQFEAHLVWLHQDCGLVGRSYSIKLSHQWGGASITNIKYRVDVNSQNHESCKQLEINDIAVCNLALSKPMAFLPYAQSSALGGFILVDRFTNATVAAGMIRHNLRRSQNIQRQILSIGREEREHLNGHAGKVIWLTGLSGSGKSTIANALEKELYAQGKRTYLLDGDNIRHGLCQDLGFTAADRVENIRRVAEVAKLMLDAGLIVVTAFISPFRQEREMAKALIGAEHFMEVFVNTPLPTCEQRDPKGLYKKARNGELPNMTGLDSPYEAPTQPDLELRTDSDVATCVQTLLRAL